MQSTLIISKDTTKNEQYVQKILSELDINSFDVFKIEQASIGIEDVRSIQKNILLSPIEKNKAILLYIDVITVEAQNALLKILEEPPGHTIIVMNAKSKEPFLPTILSRCKIVELNNNSPELSSQEYNQYLNILMSLKSLDIGSRLKLAQDISKTKDTSLDWVDHMIFAVRKKMLALVAEDSEKHLICQYLNILISLNRTHTILSTTNTNPRFALENLLINL